MAEVFLTVSDTEVELEPRVVRGRERLGEATEFRIEAFSREPIDPSRVLGTVAALRVVTGQGERLVRGTVVHFRAIATSHAGSGRRYGITLRSQFALLELKTKTRVFQKLSVPDIVKQLVTEGGYAAAKIVVSTSGVHPPREYVVQYAETDATFIRRLCEEEGLYYRFEADDEDEGFVLEDTSTAAAKGLDDALAVVDQPALDSSAPCAYRVRASARRRPGKVTLRDYNPKTPAVKLEATKTAGKTAEQEIEVYEAPGRFADPSAGDGRAARRLESLRVDADVCSFATTAVGLAPGKALSLESSPEYAGTATPDGDRLVVALEHAWELENASRYELTVETIPLAVPYRLKRATARPRIPGIHSAFVTTAPGEEIHVDKDGSVRVHFHWDREGPTDDKSSLPVRVMQPNTPGSVAIPRGGWEVMVAFEDGDPDRPYVLGRSYNGKTPPPYSLPGNKALTSLGSYSSPGGGKQNVINMNDAAGSQNLAILAGSGKSTSVASNMTTQTAKNEDLTVSGAQSKVVGAKEDVSVTQAYLNTLGSQSGTVGATQKVFVAGDFTVGVGSASVLVGAACMEKVGNPAAGAANLASAALMQGAGALGAAGAALTKAATLVQAGVAGYQKGGLSGAAAAAGGAAAGMAMSQVAGMVPGGNELVAAAGGGAVAPWVESQLAGGPAASGGGASASSDGAGAKGPGPGHRNTMVSGAYTELVGAACAATSPGTVGWTTMGASTFLVGGSRSVKVAAGAGNTVMGLSTEAVASLSITTTGDITRSVKGLLNTDIGGALTSKAGGDHSIKAGAALSIKVTGPLTLTGSHVSFVCGASKVSSSGGGLVIETPSFEVSGNTTQPGINHNP